MHVRTSGFAGLVAAALAIMAGAAAAQEAPQGVPVVAELFTSQGCSSCPPAEAVLGELSLRADVLPLAFHVTYWDDLGWKDRFSFAGADTRQYRYAAAMGRRGVYTPQLVVNGSRELVGSNRAAVLRAIDTAQPAAGIRLGIDRNTLAVDLPDLAGACDCELSLLGVLPVAQTAVGRGENSGRTLKEFNVVRQMYRLGGWTGKAQHRTEFLPQLTADATLVVLLAQRRGDARIMAVGVRKLTPG